MNTAAVLAKHAVYLAAIDPVSYFRILLNVPGGYCGPVDSGTNEPIAAKYEPLLREFLNGIPLSQRSLGHLLAFIDQHPQLVEVLDSNIRFIQVQEEIDAEAEHRAAEVAEEWRKLGKTPPWESA